MSEALPFVSVIVPVYNDPDGIRNCLEALRSQTYPDERFEVLVVDNGSTDDTREVIGEFDVELLIEDEIQGSYAARNRGIRNAQGEVLAFTDADCIPDPNWIEAGVETLRAKGADLVGGRIVFEFSEQKTAAERFDASVNMRNDQSVRDGVAKTANLFTYTAAFKDIGQFPEHLQSGGDVYWTRRATESGLILAYAHDAKVRHNARKLCELMVKHFRVGRGQAQVWRLDQRHTIMIAVESTFGFPLKAFDYILSDGETSIDELEEQPDRPKVDLSIWNIDIYMIAVLCVSAMALGRFFELI